jgi:hypothetical protein
MCDLWRNTLTETVPAGAIAAQIRHALAETGAGGPGWHLKLYNAGSFFDPRAIPPAEYEAVAALAAPFGRVVVECHPAFLGGGPMRRPDPPVTASRAFSKPARMGGVAVPAGAEMPASRLGGRRMAGPCLSDPSESGPMQETSGRSSGERCLRFRDLLAAHGTELEVAVGLETVHPEVLPRLNKRMTLAQFRSAAQWLAEHGMALRVFLMVRPPWLTEEEGVEWARRSLDYAFDCGAGVCTLIPARGGNGAMEALAAAGEWAPPGIGSLERALEYGVSLRRGRVFADLWDIERFARCAACGPARIARLREMNDTQSAPGPVACPACAEERP